MGLSVDLALLFSRHRPLASITTTRVILKLVQSILSPDQISKLTETMEAMKALEDKDRRFVIFDRNAEWTYRATESKSKAKNTPFDGWAMQGKVRWTVSEGRVVYAAQL